MYIYSRSYTARSRPKIIAPCSPSTHHSSSMESVLRDACQVKILRNSGYPAISKFVPEYNWDHIYMIWQSGIDSIYYLLPTRS